MIQIPFLILPLNLKNKGDLEKLNNDQLRSVKTDLKKQITDLKKPFQSKIDEIK